MDNHKSHVAEKSIDLNGAKCNAQVSLSVFSLLWTDFLALFVFVLFR